MSKEKANQKLIVDVTKLVKNNEPEKAERLIINYFLFNKKDSDLIYNLARLFRKSNNNSQAVRLYKQLLQANNNNVVALNELGITYYELGQNDSAEQLYRTALSLEPNYSGCLNNLGVVLQKKELHHEAILAFQRSLELEPNNYNTRYNMATAQFQKADLSGAEQSVRQCLRMDPTNDNARNTLGMILLKQGKFKEGWELYRARYSPHNPKRFVSIPHWSNNYPYWNGEELHNKTLLINPEQGFGDFIQFVRFAPRIKEKFGAKKVILLCPTQMIELCQQIKNIDEIIPADTFSGDDSIDYWSYLLDLPYYFHSEKNVFSLFPPYLSPDDATLKKWTIERKKQLRVGFVWKGQPKHKNDHNRSLPSVELLNPLLSIDNIEWFSMQKGAGEDELKSWMYTDRVTALGHKFENYCDTAAAILQLDLVISVDTSVAHLTGAIGIPCWVMLPHLSQDWRWIAGETRSPWYPEMRLFSRHQEESWNDVILRIASALECWSNTQLSRG